jgi:hypothetical protein
MHSRFFGHNLESRAHSVADVNNWDRMLCEQRVYLLVDSAGAGAARISPWSNYATAPGEMKGSELAMCAANQA